MQFKYDEVDAALAAIDNLCDDKDKELNEAFELMEMVERNNTIGLTLEDGKRLKALGLDVVLEEFGPYRTHVGLESSVALTAGQKTGLYGLAIGALVTILGWIVVKLWKWWKNRGGGSSTSSGGSKSDATKDVPSLASAPALSLSLPIVLSDEDDIADLTSKVTDFLDVVQGEIESLTSMSSTKDLTDAAIDTRRNKIVGDLSKELNKLGYKVKATELHLLVNEVKETKVSSLPFSDIKTIPLEIHRKMPVLDDAVVKRVDKVKDELEKSAKSGGTSDDKVIIAMVKQISQISTEVIKANFVKAVQIAGIFNDFTVAYWDDFEKCYGTKALRKLSVDKHLSKYFATVDGDDYKVVTAAFEKAVADKAPSSYCGRYIKLKGRLADVEKDIKSAIEGTKSDDSKKDD